MFEKPSPNGHPADGGRPHAGRAVLMIAVVSAITWTGALAAGALLFFLWPTDNEVEAIWQGMRWSPLGALLAAWGGAFIAIQLTGHQGGRLKVCGWGAVAGVIFAVGMVILTLSETRAGDIALTVSGVPLVGPLLAMVVFLAPGIAAALAVAFSR